jgi:hypothetical protein
MSVPANGFDAMAMAGRWLPVMGAFAHRSRVRDAM